MIISLNWLRDFVDVPSGIDPRELALRFTTTTAEVEGVEHHQPNFADLVAAKIEEIHGVAGESKLKTVVVNIGVQKYTSLTTAPDLAVGDVLVYAPPGATIGDKKIGTVDPQGRPAQGMIVAGQAIGLTQVAANAIFLPPQTPLGQKIDPALFNDWLIEIDNKSITHRPDCWGHYGIAREMAAMLDLPLKPYDVTNPADLKNDKLPAVAIEIDDAAKCPRYSALVMKGLASQPSPLWMQARLAYCGQRPIDLLVDLTNYVMLDLGQPMHAFDGATLPNIQVATAAPGEKFTTLDGVTRTMPSGTLMIQSGRKSVAIAGIMGGAATEVSEKTDSVLLESANFDAATIRRAATAMGHRTEASARFEKSLDPANTILGIARFYKLAKAELPGVSLASTLSDCYPAPKNIEPIMLDCDFAAKFIGKAVSKEEIERILGKLEFRCEEVNITGIASAAIGKTPGTTLRVTPPSYRATKDIQIEADLIEEVARFVGYNNIEPSMPHITARHFEKSPELTLEHRTLEYLCFGGDFIETHSYIWYDDEWLKKIGFDPGPCITLRNPAADNCSRLRTSIVPGLIAAAERNRHHFQRFQLAEIGSVFHADGKDVETSQHRCLGLVSARQGRKADAEVWEHLHLALEGWARQVLEGSLSFLRTKPARPWEDASRLAEIAVDGRAIGRVTILPLAFKQILDDRLKSWSIAVAELNLSNVVKLLDRHEKLPRVPRFPQVELDFSFLTDASRDYAEIERLLPSFKQPLLHRMSFVGAYEGGAIPPGKRSITLRALIGMEDRTLADEEIQGFQSTFKGFLAANGLELRG